MTPSLPRLDLETRLDLESKGSKANARILTTLALTTTPNAPFPTTLQLVYEISRESPVFPSWPVTVMTSDGSPTAAREAFPTVQRVSLLAKTN